MMAVCVVMAVFRPDPAALAGQLASIARQSLVPRVLILVEADGRSGESAVKTARSVLEGTGCTVVLERPGGRLDAPRAFEAGMSAALILTGTWDEAQEDIFVALSDQDDIWEPDRLDAGVAALRQAGPEALLSHGDARLVTETGAEIASSVFAFERRQKRPCLRDLLFRNNVTGMTVTMRRHLLELALPLPPQSGVHFYHDLWLALVAVAVSGPGGVVLIERPLVAYRQHRANAIGAIDRRRGLVERLRPRFRDPAPIDTGPARGPVTEAVKGSDTDAETNVGMDIGTSLHATLPPATITPATTTPAARRWTHRLEMTLRARAGAYALARYLAQALIQRLEVLRESGVIASDRARGIDFYLGGGLRGTGRHMTDAARLMLTGHPGEARIALSHSTVAMGRAVWSLRRVLTHDLVEARMMFDDRLYSLSPGLQPPLPAVLREAALRREQRAPRDRSVVADMRKTPAFSLAMSAPTPALTMLVPSLNPSEIFAGIATAIDLAAGIAARGHRVRLIATDLPVASPHASRAFVLGRLPPQAARAAADRIEVICGLRQQSITAHPRDVLLATAWWSAHLAHRLISEARLHQQMFYYLIQDFEPGFYPWGAAYAGAEESYRMNFEPIFNTTLLREDFARRGYRFAGPEALTFRPSIDIAHYADPPRPKRGTGPRRLALYGRPEVERNMFPLAIEALSGLIEHLGLTPEDIEVVSVGLHHAPVLLPNKVALHSLGKLPFEAYPGWLREVDVGLSLMFSPHPSHPPLEMAASGVRVVTNSFGPKDLSQFSPAILSVPPEAEALIEALRHAWSMGPVSDADRRIDLSPLGASLDETADLLADRLDEALGCRDPELSAGTDDTDGETLAGPGSPNGVRS